VAQIVEVQVQMLEVRVQQVKVTMVALLTKILEELMVVVAVGQVALELTGALVEQQLELELVELELHPLFQAQA
jgi:hypothetical protein